MERPGTSLQSAQADPNVAARSKPCATRGRRIRSVLRYPRGAPMEPTP
jgi:hypothetical protein